MADARPLLLPFPTRLSMTGGSVEISAEPATIGRLDPARVKRAEGYHLSIGPPPGAGPGNIELRVASEAGLRHGRATLRQLIKQYGKRMPAMEIEDEPAFRTRGVMLDISRDKVPTTATLRSLIEQFA